MFKNTLFKVKSLGHSTFCLILDLCGNFHLCGQKIKGYAIEKLTDNLDIRRHILSIISIYILQKVSPPPPLPTRLKNDNVDILGDTAYLYINLKKGYIQMLRKHIYISLITAGQKKV